MSVPNASTGANLGPQIPTGRRLQPFFHEVEFLGGDWGTCTTVSSAGFIDCGGPVVWSNLI